LCWMWSVCGPPRGVLWSAVDRAGVCFPGRRRGNRGLRQVCRSTGAFWAVHPMASDTHGGDRHRAGRRCRGWIRGMAISGGKWGALACPCSARAGPSVLFTAALVGRFAACLWSGRTGTRTVRTGRTCVPWRYRCAPSANADPCSLATARATGGSHAGAAQSRAVPARPVQGVCSHKALAEAMHAATRNGRGSGRSSACRVAGRRPAADGPRTAALLSALERRSSTIRWRQDPPANPPFLLPKPGCTTAIHPDRLSARSMALLLTVLQRTRVRSRLYALHTYNLSRCITFFRCRVSQLEPLAHTPFYLAVLDSGELSFYAHCNDPLQHSAFSPTAWQRFGGMNGGNCGTQRGDPGGDLRG